MDFHICGHIGLFELGGESGENIPNMLFGKVLHQRAEAFQHRKCFSGGLACNEESLKFCFWEKKKKQFGIYITDHILFKFQSNCEVGFIFSIQEETGTESIDNLHNILQANLKSGAG